MNTNSHEYTAAAKWLHWLIAAIVIGLIPLGLIMSDMEKGPLRGQLFDLHESFGVLLLGLMLLRLATRLRGASQPEILRQPRRTQRRARGTLRLLSAAAGDPDRGLARRFRPRPSAVVL